MSQLTQSPPTVKYYQLTLNIAVACVVGGEVSFDRLILASLTQYKYVGKYSVGNSLTYFSLKFVFIHNEYNLTPVPYMLHSPDLSKSNFNS